MQKQQVSTGPLNFSLSGFSPAETSDLGAFIRASYPRMAAIYGLPAPSQRGRTVRIIKSGIEGGGQYDARSSSATFNTIQFYLFGASEYTDDFGGASCDATCQSNAARAAGELNKYNLLRQMLLAFRGSQLTAFDAWDGGQADAAALIVLWQMLGQPARFDPSLYTFNALPAYDFLNRPQLGAKYFYTSELDSKSRLPSSYYLALIRYGMAQAAWIKVWVENPSFFSRFNTSYYARDTASVGQDASALSSIASAIVPTVEATRWDDWLRRQYVLDTGVRAGEHLYALATSPLATALYGDVYHFSTDSAGNERPLAGLGTVRAYDETGRDITALSPELRRDNRLYFDSTGEALVNERYAPDGTLPVAFFGSTGTPDRARVTLRFQAGAALNSAFYAHNVIGSDARPNGFYGVVEGSTRGRFSLQANTTLASGSVERGAFFASSTYPSGGRVQTTFRLSPTDGAAPRLFRRNTAWAFLQTGANEGTAQSVAFVFETPPSNSSVTASWPIQNANRWRLISLPAYPFESDDALALAIPAASLSLARHIPALRGPANLATAFPFGIGRDKNVFYPSTSEPLGPGRAYWLRLNASKVVTVRGGEPDRTRPFEVPLSGGWNAVGVPFNLPFSLGSVRVRVGEVTVSWGEALLRGWIGSGVWRWKPDGGFARVDTSTASTLVPFEGYFVFSPQVRAFLVFNASIRTGAVSLPVQGAGAWQVPLGVSSGTGALFAREDGFAFGCTTSLNTSFGAQPSRLAAARPPSGERSILLTFLASALSHPAASNAGNESGWAESLRAPLSVSGPVATWSFLVDGSRVGERVVLSWGDLRVVPSGWSLFLVDETARTRIEMASVPTRSYAWTASAIGRRLRIEAVPRGASGVGS